MPNPRRRILEWSASAQAGARPPRPRALPHRADAPRDLDLGAYETVPRLHERFPTHLLHRWELILCESAMLGILGVMMLGYPVDAARSEPRRDVAAVLIAATAVMTVAVDAAARALRRSLRIGTLPVRLSQPVRSDPC